MKCWKVFSFANFFVISRLENLLNWDFQYVARLKDNFIIQDVCYIAHLWSFRCAWRRARAIARLIYRSLIWGWKTYSVINSFFSSCIHSIFIFSTILWLSTSLPWNYHKLFKKVTINTGFRKNITSYVIFWGTTEMVN